MSLKRCCGMRMSRAHARAVRRRLKKRTMRATRLTRLKGKDKKILVKYFINLKHGVETATIGGGIL